MAVLTRRANAGRLMTIASVISTAQGLGVRAVADLADLGVVGLTHHAAAEPSRLPAPLPLAVVVQHRELVLGCHSLGRFLDPRWETAYVFGHELARVLHAREVLSSAPTRGATLVELDRISGNVLAQAIALRLWPDVPALASMDCDLHPLPVWHAWHLSMQTIIERMLHTLLADTAHRASQTGSHADRNRCSQTGGGLKAASHAPLLAVNTYIVNSMLPSNRKTLEGAQTHGVEVPPRSNRPIKSGTRPAGLALSAPWVSDVSTFAEDHALLYNASMLGGFVGRLRAHGVECMYSPRALACAECRVHGAAIVRANELHLLFDTRHAPALFGAGVYEAGGIDVEALQLYSMRSLAARRSPASALTSALAMRNGLGIAPDFWNGFADEFVPPAVLTRPPERVRSGGTQGGGAARADQLAFGTLMEALPLVLPALRALGYEAAVLPAAGELVLARTPHLFARELNVSDWSGPLDATACADAGRLFLVLEPARAQPMALCAQPPSEQWQLATDVAELQQRWRAPATLILPLAARVAHVRSPFTHKNAHGGWQKVHWAQVRAHELAACRALGELGNTTAAPKPERMNVTTAERRLDDIAFAVHASRTDRSAAALERLAELLRAGASARAGGQLRCDLAASTAASSSPVLCHHGCAGG